jgi:hypothetical protein
MKNHTYLCIRCRQYKITVLQFFWNMTPCDLIAGYWWFFRIFCLQLSPTLKSEVGCSSENLVLIFPTMWLHVLKYYYGYRSDSPKLHSVKIGLRNNFFSTKYSSFNRILDRHHMQQIIQCVAFLTSGPETLQKGSYSESAI